MTGGTIVGRFDIVLLTQFSAEFKLILCRPIHVRDAIKGPYVFFRIAVAIETPTHTQSFGLLNLFHLVHAPMAGRTTNAAVDMYAVVEVSVVRQVMDPFPLNWFASRVALANFQ